MDPTLIIVVLTSHHKRTHRDVWEISPLDILRGQIKVRVPAQNECVREELRHSHKWDRRTGGLLEIHDEAHCT